MNSTQKIDSEVFDVAKRYSFKVNLSGELNNQNVDMFIFRKTIFDYEGLNLNKSEINNSLKRLVDKREIIKSYGIGHYYIVDRNKKEFGALLNGNSEPHMTFIDNDDIYKGQILLIKLILQFKKINIEYSDYLCAYILKYRIKNPTTSPMGEYMFVADIDLIVEEIKRSIVDDVVVDLSHSLNIDFTTELTDGRSVLRLLFERLEKSDPATNKEFQIFMMNHHSSNLLEGENSGKSLQSGVIKSAIKNNLKQFVAKGLISHSKPYDKGSQNAGVYTIDKCFVEAVANNKLYFDINIKIIKSSCDIIISDYRIDGALTYGNDLLSSFIEVMTLVFHFRNNRQFVRFLKETFSDCNRMQGEPFNIPTRSLRKESVDILLKNGLLHKTENNTYLLSNELLKLNVLKDAHSEIDIVIEANNNDYSFGKFMINID